MGSWKEDEKDRSIGTLAINLIELKEALLSRIEAMETALWEAKSTASHDAQQVEELKVLQGSLTAKIQELEHRLAEKEDLSDLLDKQKAEIRSQAEAKVGMLEAQLRETEESLTAEIR
ncbi:MAG: hypothetical protein IH919_09495, partial [Deltaproteobacteria bacterium]|nr:hypothetical protein [Deltaproteobacteria bacterium]